MNGMAQLIESELISAILQQDKEAIKRISLIFGPTIEKTDRIEKENNETKSDVKTIAEVIKEGFAFQNKRFEDMQKYMDRRFEDMQKYMNKRFEELRQDMDKRFNMMFKFMSIGFTVVSLLIIVFKFIK